MAVSNPSNLYSGGAVVFDSRPETNMYAQLMLRKKAKEEALDEYERERINHVNPQGVRDSDRPGFDQRLQKIQLYYQQNKDKIKKGNTPESFEHEKNLRDVSTFINQSKERTAKQDAAMKFYQDKLKQDGRIPDDFMKELEVNDKAIDDIVTFDKVTGEPIRSSTFDLKKWLDTPKPFNQQTFIKGMADIKRTATPTRYEKIATDPLKQNEITEEVFDKDAKGVIAFRAADKYQNSYSFAETVKEEIKDPNNRKELADLFVQEYGTPPVSGEDYATAYSLKLLQPKVTKTKAVPNQSAIKDRDEKFKKEQQERTISASLARLRESIAAGRIPWMNATQTATYVINADNTSGENNPVNYDAEKYETLTGVKPSRNSELRSDGKGGYIYGNKDVDGNFTEKGRVDPVTAQDRLTKAASKSKVPNPAIGNNPPKPVNPKPGGSSPFIFPSGKTKF